jgi:hypothetical protein
MSPVWKPELKTEVTAPDARQVPKTAIAVTLSGIVILLAVLILRLPKDYVGIPLVIGSMLFMLGLKVTIESLPDRRVPTWLALSIVGVLVLSLSAAVGLAWVLSRFG